MTAFKIQPCIPGLTEEESREQGRISVKQEAAIQRILAEPTKAALIGSDMGFGKTLVTSEVVVRAGWGRVLYVIVGKTFSQWQERLSLQSDGAIALRRLDATKAGQIAYSDFLAGKAGHYAVTIQWLQAQDWKYEPAKDAGGNPLFKIVKKTGEHVLKERPEGVIGPAAFPVRESMRTHLKTFEKMSNRLGGAMDAVIFDEVHAVASRTSVGRRTLMTIQTEWKIALSGTWAGNSLADHGWATPRWCWPDKVPAYWNWRSIYFEERPKLKPNGDKVYVGGKAMTEPHEIEPGTWVRSLPLYIRDENNLKAPPAIPIYVDPTAMQAQQYAELKEELLAWVNNWRGDREPLVIDVPAVLRIRLRQVALAALSLDEKGEIAFHDDAPSAKLQALRGILDAWGGQPVILMTDSRKFAKLTAERMTRAGYRAEAWIGGLSEKETERIKSEYLAGDLKYIVLTVQAGGTGLDFMQRKSSKIIWLSVPDGDPKLEAQALARVFRTGMTTEYGPFQHIRLLQRESLDVEILESLLAKGRTLQASIGAAALAS